MLDDVDFEDPILGEDGFDTGSLGSFDFEDDFFGVDVSGGGAVLVDAVFGNAPGGVAFVVAVGEGATFGVSFGGAVFDSFVFEGEAAAFAGTSFALVFFGVTTVAGLGSGARSIKDATGALVGGAVNCPLAIWRARSFTLTNILTGRKVHVQQNDPGDAHAFYGEHDSFSKLWPQCAQACAPQAC